MVVVVISILCISVLAEAVFCFGIDFVVLGSVASVLI